MRALITVTEYARLTTAPGYSSLAAATVTSSAFEWLCAESARLRKDGAPLVQVQDRRCLALDSYVGVIETPCGTRIEVLPKHVDDGEDVVKLRRLMVRMLSTALDIKARSWGPTDLHVFDYPVSEWVMRTFLEAVEHLLKRGIRSEYKRIEEESRYLRGQLNLPRQLRQPPGREHLVHIQHDVFTPDRAENRLIRSALDVVRKRTREGKNWRLAQELTQRLEEIPQSTDLSDDLRAWRDDRLMAHYSGLKPLCELILTDRMPLSQVGDWNGTSMLFPMERLFERYVAAMLSKTIAPGWKFSYQTQSKYLCTHLERQWFKLKPDIGIRSDQAMVILDTKWKRLDGSSSNTKDKYGLKQSDFYQLFAYGEKYLGGQGDLFLIYPKTRIFTQSLPKFHFSEGLRLWVVPFDLDAGKLVLGAWLEAAPWLAQSLTQAA